MLGRMRRRFSRTQSVVEIPKHEDELKRKFTLSPSDEELISHLRITEDIKTSNELPRTFYPSLDREVATGVVSNRTILNNVEKGILSLPTEVLLALEKYLIPSSEVALRNACARFLHLYRLPSFYLSGDDKFEWLCMYERDQDQKQLAKLVCSHCKDLHPRGAFPAAEKKLEPAVRDCRQVWLCAHKHLGYQQVLKDIKPGHESPFKAQSLESCSRCREIVRNRSVADRPEKGTTETDLNSVNIASLLITKIALLQRPAPAYKERTTSGESMYRDIFSVSDVSNALNALDFPICAHVQLSDPYMLSRFCRACINTQKLPPGVKGPPCISENRRNVGDPEYLGKCKQSCYTRGCRTRFMWQARESLTPDASGRRQVWLIMSIYRWLGPLQSDVRDSMWYSHTHTHAARSDMRQKWETLEKTRRGNKPMPDWSICLLNPEDCNVREGHPAPYKPSNKGNVEDALKGVILNWRK